ncbi:hypothetical protein F5887DRAFT_993643 [Amanita rubescens]|nr:hypothetical protein F5887DRAFT_993643 [Amanita rubescens]
MPVLHLSTIISRNSTSLLSHISRLARSFPNHPLLFTLSHNSTTDSAVDLSRIVGQLTTFSSQSIGCLSAPLPGPHSGFTACSLAIFDPQNVAAVFRSTVPGRQRAQVGRWRPVGQKKELDKDLRLGQGWWQGESVKDWENVWNSSVETQVLPEGLKGKEDISSIVYLTDDAPEGLSSSLLSNYSNSSQIGLVASSTPFVNGRPFTLFHNKHVYDLGAVGIALKGSSTRDFASGVSFVGLSPVSKPMNVTRCEGNMVISLDDQNPTQLLLSCIRESSLAETPSSLKDDLGFVLGVVEDGELVQVHKITAGDPSRGTISLGTQSSPKEGATVQFFHRGTNSLHDPLTEQGILFAPYASTGEEPSFKPKSLNFFSVTGDDMFKAQANSEGAYILQDTFIAASENGFLFSPKQRELRENSWTCAVPGAFATLECVYGD